MYIWKKTLGSFLVTSQMAVYTLLCLHYSWRAGISSHPAKPARILNIRSIRKRISSVAAFKEYFYYIVCFVCVSACVCVKVRGQFVGVSSSMWDLSSGHQIWWQVPLSTEPSLSLLPLFHLEYLHCLRTVTLVNV